MLCDDVLHLTRLERDIPSLTSETAGCIDRFHPFVQPIPPGLVIGAVGARDLDREGRAVGNMDQKIRGRIAAGSRLTCIRPESLCNDTAESALDLSRFGAAPLIT